MTLLKEEGRRRRAAWEGVRLSKGKAAGEGGGGNAERGWTEHRRTGGQHSRKRERELAKGAETDQKLEILNGLNVQSVSIVS